MIHVRQRFGKYKIRRRLACGGYGEVFKAYDTIEGIDVALKIPLDKSRAEIKHLLREVRLTAALDHPNILPIKNADFIEDLFTIVQPLGVGSFEGLFHKYRRASLGIRLSCVGQLLAGLQHAHDRKVIHCDVKPENIIVFPNDILRLADFGIAKYLPKTNSGSGSGSLGYIAPEQAMGCLSSRSDLFSVGVILHRLLTGALPLWPLEWPFHPALAHYHPSLQKVVRRALKIDHRKRYPTACSMWRSIERVYVAALEYDMVRQKKQRKTPARK